MCFLQVQPPYADRIVGQLPSWGAQETCKPAQGQWATLVRTSKKRSVLKRLALEQAPVKSVFTNSGGVKPSSYHSQQLPEIGQTSQCRTCLFTTKMVFPLLYQVQKNSSVESSSILPPRPGELRAQCAHKPHAPRSHGQKFGTQKGNPTVRVTTLFLNTLQKIKRWDTCFFVFKNQKQKNSEIVEKNLTD